MYWLLPAYVSATPDKQGKDWGYTNARTGKRVLVWPNGWQTVDAALPLSPYWQRRFRADCARVGMTFHAVPVS